MSPDLVVSTDEPRLPRPCRPAAVGTLIVDLFRAINSGKVRLDDFFNPFDPKQASRWSIDDGFQWFSDNSPPPTGMTTYRPGAELARYFRERHSAGERFELEQVRVTDVDLSTDQGTFSLWMLRGKGASPSARTSVKGWVSCKSGKLGLWSMAPAGSASAMAPCPGVSAPDRAIACAQPRGPGD